MVSRANLPVALLVLLLGGAIPSTALAACETLLPKAAANMRHAVGPDDLARLRDIGVSEVSTSDPSPLAISPDGRQVAFVLSQADPTTDSYCRGVVVVDITEARPPSIIDRGGTLITQLYPYRGYLNPDGVQTTAQIAWSPDGRHLAYLRRDHTVTQLWVVDVVSDSSRPATQGGVDVAAFAWKPDGKSLIYTSKPALAEAASAIDVAGRAGWLYDAAISPDYGPRPQLPGTIATVARVVDDDGSHDRLADNQEQRSIGRQGNLQAVTADGRPIAVRSISARPFAPTQITVGLGAAAPTCRVDPCSKSVFALFWDRERRQVLFLRREGFHQEMTALYAWVPGAGIVPRRIMATNDLLLGCAIGSKGLLCLDENATHPRHLVAIDPARGVVRTVFDPNPEVAAWKLGKVRRLRFINKNGLPAWGDLVLPPDYRRGQKVPMVVVQYHSVGFLRGGTGNEYPIFALAARGMAVLSFERPPFFAQSMAELPSWDAFTAANLKGWAERYNVQSSIEAGVRSAVATGAIDPTRLGISGLSDGSTSARFALINAPGLFRAAAISTCCADMRTTMTYGGIAWADFLRAQGYPPASNEDEAFWRPASMVLNADRMSTPLLMQLADNEYLLSLETFTALREHHQPVEMYVFPDEFHMKWHPAHRLAIYRRNIDWFAYWLLDKVDPDPAKAPQYARWAKMMRAPASSSGGPRP